MAESPERIWFHGDYHVTYTDIVDGRRMLPGTTEYVRVDLATPANPAQGVRERTLADVVATIEEGKFYEDYDQSVSDLRILRAAIGAGGQPGWRPTHRHKKRGSEYEMIGIGKMQTGRWVEPNIYPNPGFADEREVIVYRGENGKLWVRPREEFEDGRFEPLSVINTPVEDGYVLMPAGNPVSFDDCPVGLFLFGDTLCVMTEYATMTETVPPQRQRDAYIIESGEYFCGGTSRTMDRAKLMVQPLAVSSGEADHG